MCVKIIKPTVSEEFNPHKPLEQQVIGAKSIMVNYDPKDPTKGNIETFLDQIERLCRNGISCNVDINMNANNSLTGIRLERKLEKLKVKLNVNEIVKGLCIFHAETDKKLSELSSICLEKLDER